MGSIRGMSVLSWIEHLLIHHKYEPLPESDEDYSDEESEEEESEGLEYEGESETEGSRKRRLSKEPRRGKRQRLDRDDDGVCIIPATEDWWTDNLTTSAADDTRRTRPSCRTIE